MNYYRINNSIVESEVGSTFPQAQTAKHPVKYDAPNHLENQYPGVPLRLDVGIPQPVLHPDAKLTDLVSSIPTSSRLLISSRLKVILEKSIRPGVCDLFPVSVWYVNMEHPYWLLHPVVFDAELIDFPKSDIWLLAEDWSKKQKADIKNYADYKIMFQKTVYPEKLYIVNVVFSTQKAQDFMQLTHVNGGIGYYVSEKLKKEIEDAGCTGITFEELNNG